VEKVIYSKARAPFPKWARFFIIFLGLLILSYSIKTFFNLDIDQLKLTFPYTVVGVTCIFIAGFEKQLAVSTEGLMKIYRSWGMSGKDIIPWSEVVQVDAKESDHKAILLFKTSKKGMMGEFPREGLEEIRKTLHKIDPPVDVNII
jgi:divalent metal cation (Fe/Co/Zn/Cd) transporter